MWLIVGVSLTSFTPNNATLERSRYADTRMNNLYLCKSVARGCSHGDKTVIVASLSRGEEKAHFCTLWYISDECMLSKAQRGKQGALFLCTKPFPLSKKRFAGSARSVNGAIMSTTLSQGHNAFTEVDAMPCQLVMTLHCL